MNEWSLSYLPDSWTESQFLKPSLNNLVLMMDYLQNTCLERNEEVF